MECSDSLHLLNLNLFHVFERKKKRWKSFSNFDVYENILDLDPHTRCAHKSVYVVGRDRIFSSSMCSGIGCCLDMWLRVLTSGRSPFIAMGMLLLLLINGSGI